MPLTSGTRLGSYEIVSSLGAGGMGEVYRARDTKLHRQVAIKILPEVFARDAERLARFEREAHVLASLNHPNIAQIYGLEESPRAAGPGPSGTRALVMEMVEGDDLSQRLSSGAIPIAEALAIAKQIADALEAAHAQGVVHRDLKPANVKVRGDGTVKVLDFGLAKALAPEGAAAQGDAANSPTLTSPAMTAMGMILGTAAYMSPEQARGKTVDERADIWAFGVILYEMLTGRRAFDGGDINQTLAFVLTKELDWNTLPAGTSPAVRRLLRRALAKDPHARLAAIADARLDLVEAMTEPADALPSPPIASQRARLWPALLPWALLGAATVVGAAMWVTRTAPAPTQVVRALVDFPQSAISGARLGGLIAISQDGRRLVYVGNPDGKNRLYVRPLDQPVATPLAGTEEAIQPFFSPDGNWVGFFAGGKLKKVSLAGGQPVPLADARDPRGGSWGADDTIVFAPALYDGLKRIRADGGEAEAVTRTPEKGGVSHRWPLILPGNRFVLVTVSTSAHTSRIDAVSLSTGATTRVVEAGSSPVYVPTGRLIYAHPSSGTLWAVPFDLDSAAATGKPVAVQQDVMASQYSAQYGVSNTGVLVYLPNTTVAERSLVWVDRRGIATPITPDRRAYGPPRLSLDTRKVAFTLYEGLSPRTIAVYDFQRGVQTNFTSEGLTNTSPAWWPPDGTRIAFSSSREGAQNLFWAPSDGTGRAERLATSPYIQTSLTWAPDGKTLVFRQNDPTTGMDLWAVSVDGDRAPRLLLDSTANEEAPAFSPDGRLIAYLSDQSGRQEVYVVPYPGPGPRTQVSVDGGTEPVWSPKGDELFYRQGEKMMAVGVTTKPTFTASKPRVLFEGRYETSFQALGFTFYDVDRDAQRFVMVKSDKPSAPPQLQVVVNWTEELKRIVPAGR